MVPFGGFWRLVLPEICNQRLRLGFRDAQVRHHDARLHDLRVLNPP
jgi:hypothetical protein